MLNAAAIANMCARAPKASKALVRRVNASGEGYDAVVSISVSDDDEYIIFHLGPASGEFDVDKSAPVEAK